MTDRTCLICPRKSANEPYVKAAVKAVRKQGIDHGIANRAAQVRERLFLDVCGRHIVLARASR